ncbi:translation initiation factor IF-2 subunit alpha [Candidatus Micrarchaeota archaeon]|nr:translation initiation factor IF-2 subunit alpha [Candidatus Micrarchaeota archaeon]
MPNYPERGEFVIAKVKKILPFGAILSLDEYSAQEAFVHISEVSSGWVRNIRDHVKEGQLTVAKVIRVDESKHQVDVSLKSVSESDKKRKLQLNQSEKRARKMLEVVAKKLGKPLAVALQEAGKPLEDAYGDLYAAFEAMAAGQELSAKIPKMWAAALTELAKKEIKPKRVFLKAHLTLKSYAPDGLDQVKAVLAKIDAQSFPDAQKTLRYVSAPTYLVEVETDQFKRAEKIMAHLSALLEREASAAHFEAAFTVQR